MSGWGPEEVGTGSKERVSKTGRRSPGSKGARATAVDALHVAPRDGSGSVSSAFLYDWDENTASAEYSRMAVGNPCLTAFAALTTGSTDPRMVDRRCASPDKRTRGDAEDVVVAAGRRTDLCC